MITYGNQKVWCCMSGQMDGWMGGWMDGKASLRIAYSNQQTLK